MTESILFSWDARRDIAIPGDQDETLAFAVEHFITTAQNAILHHGKFFVALSGGSTPKAIYERLADKKNRERIDWEQVYLFWSDERSVPSHDPQSNYLMAMEAGLGQLSIPKNQIFRMVAESDIQENAKKYEQKIHSVLTTHSFDLMMLGMGEDGHTASLFPGTEALKDQSRWIVANFVPSQKSWRMTMTIPCINRSTQIAFYVLGENKAQMLAKVLLAKKAEYPAALVGSAEHKALWIADKSAAKEIQKQLL